ncbi:SRPBCC family protein [Flavobacterium beibuense]|uniref:Activator of Hsp90 ATPase 1 family protein n=1 Tax=Flavobacterium beibuense TaxID=657326 RepID=A0A444WA02_9FLAO|nr:SRPBCC domain-containing protein [Flavobacterium beibuense]RYJ42582.1 Activator of Hsp90 ATPase 1 family protein [Flavobacterium beibuense]
METTTKPLTLERTYNATADRVWSAITDVSKMRQWYFNLEAFEPRVGFKFQFAAGCEGEDDYIHLCEVTEVDECKKITYSWKYEDREGMSYVSWELFPEGDKTKLVLTHKGLETFPPHKDFTRDSFNGGWTHFLGALQEYVENK